MIYNRLAVALGTPLGGKNMDTSESNNPQTNSQAREMATIGKSVVIKGELSGSEDLYIDGKVEGNIDLRNHNLTIGPSGSVKAGITAKSIVIQGKVDGSLTASDRLDLRKSAVVTGDVSTQRIAIEEGAFLKGKVDIQKEIGKGAAS
jgi:cytoskeletal protein CcmA (bactofilin family)